MYGFGLVDIVPTLILPTWSNHKVGCENICKSLERFLISVDFIDYDLHFHEWVGYGGNSDH